jgi:hypothetical protein
MLGLIDETKANSLRQWKLSHITWKFRHCKAKLPFLHWPILDLKTDLGSARELTKPNFSRPLGSTIENFAQANLIRSFRQQEREYISRKHVRLFFEGAPKVNKFLRGGKRFEKLQKIPKTFISNNLCFQHPSNPGSFVPQMFRQGLS